MAYLVDVRVRLARRVQRAGHQAGVALALADMAVIWRRGTIATIQIYFVPDLLLALDATPDTVSG